MIENHVKIYASYKHNVTLIPNFYPQGKEVMTIVNSYHKDIAKFQFQGRKAYFRYTFSPVTSVVSNPIAPETEPEPAQRQSVSSFVSEKEKSILNMNIFNYVDASKEEDLNMTIHKNNSDFFNESLLGKLNVPSDNSCDSSSKLQVAKAKHPRDIRTHHTSLDSIEDLIEEIKLIEEDKAKLVPVRKANNFQQAKLQLKHGLLLTSLRTELQQANIRNDYSTKRYKFKTRKEKFTVDFLSKLH